MEKPILYMAPTSPSVKSCLMVARWIGLELELRNIDLGKKHHLSADFVKLNPAHTVPTLDDNGFIIWDSHAICTYLIDKYAPDDQLYPKDLNVRTTINKFLFFDASTLFRTGRNAIFGIFFEGNTGFTEWQLNGIRSSYETLNNLLKDTKFLAGDVITLADLICAPTITQMEAAITVEADEYPNISGWKERLDAELPYYDEINIQPFNVFKLAMERVLESNRAAVADDDE